MAKNIELNLYYHNQNVRGRKGLKQGHFTIYSTIVKIRCNPKETFKQLCVQIKWNRARFSFRITDVDQFVPILKLKQSLLKILNYVFISNSV